MKSSEEIARKPGSSFVDCPHRLSVAPMMDGMNGQIYGFNYNRLKRGLRSVCDLCARSGD